MLPTHTCYSTKFETGNTPQDTSPHHRRNPTQPQYTILSIALYPDCNDDSQVNGRTEANGPNRQRGRAGARTDEELVDVEAGVDDDDLTLAGGGR